MGRFHLWVKCPGRFFELVRKKKPSGRKRGDPRYLRDLRRIPGKRIPWKVIVIVCEGEKTEPLYFGAIRQSLRMPSLNIRIVPGQGAPISIVNRAIEEKKCTTKYDDVWCVFDVEQIANNTSFLEAVDKARRAKINLAITNPAFEYWYLLHFFRTDRPFINAEQVIGQLKKYLPKYDKSISVYESIRDKTDTAIANACELRKISEEEWENWSNSSTGVDKLLTRIMEIFDR